MLQFGRLNKIKKSSPNIFEAESTTFDSKNKLCYSDLWFDCSVILPISSCNLIFCGCSRYRRSICYLFFLELTLCYGFLICSRKESYLRYHQRYYKLWLKMFLSERAIKSLYRLSGRRRSDFKRNKRCSHTR